MPLAGCHVLIAEDEAMIAADLAEILERAGATVSGPYDNLIDAIELVSSGGAIDGAILDIGLQDLESYAMADALLATRIPFVFLTGRTRDELPPRFARVPHLLKPFNGARLIDALIDAGVNAR